MIQDSAKFKHSVTWFSSMLGKKSSLDQLEKQLRATLGKGNIRVTEFVQGKMRRWGLAWTFRSVPPRSQGLKIKGSKFEVKFSDKHALANGAVDCVVARMRSYCQSLKGMDVSLSAIDGPCESATVTIVGSKKAFHCGKEDISRFVEPDEKCIADPNPKNSIEFLIDAIVEEKMKIDQHPTQSGSQADVVVEVSLTCFSHSTAGTVFIGKIRNQMIGEVNRTNRKWRRILAAGAKKALV
uniref:Uncharacterized protein n=2 Tax=Odontella aurita TaxID=265563 RepID=A0A7S4J603_9STRA|mmetsp:Transcript_39541/g.118671  ORF Transcript_39541/g.118671 Transcript_39541/m.118671 type:complete len:239 (+) Transcript_39541:1117-1833(+)